MPRPIIVIGSINMDLVCRAPAMPRPGETMVGSDFATVPGGKGANQAVAAARLSRGGGEVHMVGRVGDDEFGRQLLAGLRDNGVQTGHVRVTAGAGSGVAMIVVDRHGENSIVVAPGANAQVSPADVDAAEELIRGAAAVVLQLEIPLATVRHAVALCRRLGVFTILDPAPVPPTGVPRAVLAVDVLTPNETEAAMLVGGSAQPAPAPAGPQGDSTAIARALLARGPRAVVLKLGARGSVCVDGDGTPRQAKPFKIKAVDTTAAGDAFTAALAVARAEGATLIDALPFVNAAGALACMARGAQPALPTRDTLERLLATGREGRRRTPKRVVNVNARP